MLIIEKIKAHEKEVLSGIIPANLKACVFCKSSTESIRRHEGRYRMLYIVKGCYVDRRESCLCRWKCLICEKTFTYYPEYIIPYKRYIKESITEFCKKYLSNDEITYLDVVKSNGFRIVHKDSEDTITNEFSGTSVWRWLKYLSTLEKLKQNALKLIREKSPACTIFRTIYLVSARKYRTTMRKEQLEKSMKLLDVAMIFKKEFGNSIFPHFATRYG